MRTYKDLFRAREYTPLFAAVCAQGAGTTVSGLALGVLVYSSTRSPLLASLSMFGSAFAQLFGAVFLMSAADRLPPRATMTGLGLLFAACTVVLAVPGLPLWAVFVIILGVGVASSVGGGVRFGLLTEILPAEGYLLGRSVLSMASGIQQVAGFALGGVLVAAASPRGALLVAAALYLAAGLISRYGLSPRPPRASGRPSVRETWRTNAELWSSRARRRIYLLLWVPNGLIVGCESLFVPYAPAHAGLLFALAALGMLAGDTVVGRFVPPALRPRLGPALRLLLAVPYLAFAPAPPLPVAAVLVTVASVGYSASLLLQDRLVALTPQEMSGQALGLQWSGILTMQGVGAAIAGAVAQFTSPATAMTVMAAASVAVTLALAPDLRRDPDDCSAAQAGTARPARTGTGT
ncbi:MFS transporter [Bailinhaonella thermotolerans]|uniref:MFS transporter n=1 Tax=Bailinhaonella thermotolerans TaxID=1070861 RepID=A0A3A4AMP7_9ACTN|nr:MFS transporter [Bailinhaonella thermotolerans]RJL27093.1 MFS transporter [Bailinhaonella thermotolerans]